MNPYLILIGGWLCLMCLALKAGMLCSYREIVLPTYRPAGVEELEHHHVNRKRRQWGALLTILAIALMMSGFLAVEHLLPSDQYTGLWLWAGASVSSLIVYALSWWIRVAFNSTFNAPTLS